MADLKIAGAYHAGMMVGNAQGGQVWDNADMAKKGLIPKKGLISVPISPRISRVANSRESVTRRVAKWWYARYFAPYWMKTTKSFDTNVGRAIFLRRDDLC